MSFALFAAGGHDRASMVETVTPRQVATSTVPYPAGAPDTSSAAGPGSPTAHACPNPSPVPTVDDFGTYCGPPPEPGNGRGPQGTCDGTESEPPCGPGVEPNRYYPYTVPGSCDGRIRFDGRVWTSQLPPPRPIEAFPVWMRLSSSGELRFVGHGSVGFTLTKPSDPTACRS
jgi:hypothetical protein